MFGPLVRQSGGTKICVFEKLGGGSAARNHRRSIGSHFEPSYNIGGYQRAHMRKASSALLPDYLFHIGKPTGQKA